MIVVPMGIVSLFPIGKSKGLCSGGVLAFFLLEGVPFRRGLHVLYYLATSSGKGSCEMQVLAFLPLRKEGEEKGY